MKKVLRQYFVLCLWFAVMIGGIIVVSLLAAAGIAALKGRVFDFDAISSAFALWITLSLVLPAVLLALSTVIVQVKSIVDRMSDG